MLVMRALRGLGLSRIGKWESRNIQKACSEHKTDAQLLFHWHLQVPDCPHGKYQNHKVGDDVHHHRDDIAGADIYTMAWDIGMPDLLARYALTHNDDDGNCVEYDIRPNHGKVDPINPASLHRNEELVVQE